MNNFLLRVRRDSLKWLLAFALAVLFFQLLPGGATIPEHVKQVKIDMALRNDDYPNTYIRLIHIDLTSPHHWVRLTWSGPKSGSQETGPFHSSPGAGIGRYDCNDMIESNNSGSYCTPKGTWHVEGFSDYMPSIPICRYVTWFNLSREIALHSHIDVPDYPASHGCVRLDEHAAQLIHNNSIVGVTKVIVDGTWTPPSRGGP